MFKNLIITCFLGMIAVLLGAFGAHSLKEILTADQLLSFDTAVRYQIYHVIVLLFINMYDGFSSKQKNTTSYLFFLGILLFSGSIYLIQLTAVSVNSIWFITPLGGFFFVLGWLSLIMIFIKKSINNY